MAAHYWSDMCDRKTCLYRCYDGDELLYVGISLNPTGRLSQHHAKPWRARMTRMDLEWFSNRSDALVAERHAIRDENPTYNITRPRVECC